MNEKPKTDARPPKEDVSPLTTTANSSLRRDSGNTVSPLSGSPKQHDIVKFGPSSPTKEPTSPGSPGRQILVRFADKDKTKTIGRTEVSPTSSKSSLQLSSLDEKWGVLFDDRGSATKRLEQVLRGLANYIVSELSCFANVDGLLTGLDRLTSSCLRRASSSRPRRWHPSTPSTNSTARCIHSRVSHQDHTPGEEAKTLTKATSNLQLPHQRLERGNRRHVPRPQLRLPPRPKRHQIPPQHPRPDTRRLRQMDDMHHPRLPGRRSQAPKQHPLGAAHQRRRSLGRHIRASTQADIPPPATRQAGQEDQTPARRRDARFRRGIPPSAKPSCRSAAQDRDHIRR